jgi:hypothetical protein
MMGPQDVAAALNTHLSLFILTAVAVAAGLIGFVCGRWSMWKTATDTVQLALERAARDIRLFHENRYGAVGHGHPIRKLLTEIEYIVDWRSRGLNYLVKPSGEPRTRRSDEPRSAYFRRQRQRNQIFGFVVPPASDDTGVVTRRERTNRRFR